MEQFVLMERTWDLARDYLKILQSKQEKWAFAFTHSIFTAGVSSTQRQEMINHQVKSGELCQQRIDDVLCEAVCDVQRDSKSHHRWI